MILRLFAILIAVAIAGCGHASSSLPPGPASSSHVTPEILHVVPLIKFAGGSYGAPPSGAGAAASQFAGRAIPMQPTGGCIGLFGSIPGGLGGLIGDPRKALFGVFSCGGVNNCGVVYELTPTSSGPYPYKETVLHTFLNDPDGCAPTSALVMDQFGAIYGTTAEGGNGSGTVFKLRPSLSGYNYTVIYRFLGGSDGSTPEAPVLVLPNGALYGTTTTGGGTSCQPFGLACGTLFELVRPLGPFSETYRERVVYRFQGGSDGAEPEAGLISDSAGNLYGTTQLGGSGTYYGNGTAFKLTRARNGYVETVIQMFGDTGVVPTALTLVGTDLFGALLSGELFKLAPSGSTYTMSAVHLFQLQTIYDGLSPDAPLTFRDGILYGTTLEGGIYQNIGGGQYISNGTVFSVDTSGANFHVLYRFKNNDALGRVPSGGQLLDVDGVLYGTTIFGGGPASDGAAYAISP